MSTLNNLSAKISQGTAKIAVLGLGYVGLPLAAAFAKKYKVIGFDVNEEKLRALSENDSYIEGIPNDILRLVRENFTPTNDEKMILNCDFKIICVPTPLDELKEPELKYVKDACKTISRNLKKEQFIILESTTYPGTTDEVVIPVLERRGLKAGIDFGVAYSPERIDPGNIRFTVENTPKIVGGINKECTEISAMLYKSIINAPVMQVENCRTAEATKIVENIFREVNIALVSELALVFEKMNINIWDVIDAASTKPFGFMPFYPGPGIGGHCIPLDPYYLSYKAKKIGQMTRFIELSGEVNEFMKMHVVNLASTALKNVNKEIRNSTIAVLGLSYKKNIDDIRESPSIKVIEEFAKMDAEIKVYDPFVSMLHTRYGKFTSEKSIEDTLKDVDCAIFMVDHDAFKNLDLVKYKDLMKHNIIIDCKNIFDNIKDYEYYGIGKPQLR